MEKYPIVFYWSSDIPENIEIFYLEYTGSLITSSIVFRGKESTVNAKEKFKSAYKFYKLEVI